ncbi:MAG: ABC transporter ATP-binding protein [Candidatus Omnitrophica bacterium]|nr:ABC transporter ATP-binding protein [Candidatus Omnitrophota bacterium]MCM8790985.1 ABC transporter ATP-binding protein [Candidatus Omnitrophota bacterium]
MIEIKDVYKSFNGHQVLAGTNLTINTGETTVIIGRSGCGKSVLLKHIIGLLKPDSGKILIDGKDITKMDEKELNSIRMRFGMLFQGAALFDSLNVLENVAFGMIEHTNADEEAIKKRVKECLALVGLKGIEYKKPAELSGGMRKRVGLARAIALRPQIMLYDEPTTGVDPIMGDSINDLIIELHNKLKVTSIAVTHDMTSAYKIADRIAMLYNGKIIAEGTPEEIKNTKDPVVRQFITGASRGPITEGIDFEHLI